MIHGARWKCRSCKSDFAKPEKWYSGSSIGHSPDGIICPYCKSEDIGMASSCSMCNGTFFDDELTYGLCESCIEDYLSDHADEYIKSDPDVWDAFAFFMHKRIGGGEE